MDYIDKIKEARIKSGETQASMAELLKTTRQQYSKYENKLQELPIRHLVTICANLGLSADELLELKEGTEIYKSIYESNKKKAETALKLAQAEMEILELKEQLRQMSEELHKKKK